MMYQNKLVASVKANGKILREFKENVYVPFGSEYSILLKNLNTVRAIVNIFIDGENQVPGGLVINAGQEVDLQRSLKNGNLNEGNRFKFIERTAGVEQHRGAKLEDGIVRIEFQFERPVIRTPDWYSNQPIYTKGGYSTTRGISGISGSIASPTFGASSATLSSTSAVNASMSNQTFDWHPAPQNETGITVAGGKSDQKFVTVSDFPVEVEKHSIVLRLLGETEQNKVITEAVTVKHKPECPTCGRKNKASAKFCTDCGTSLVLY